MGLTHNFGLSWFSHPQWGLLVHINKPTFDETSGGVLSIWRQSLSVEGALLFNCMPSSVRNFKGDNLNSFKMTS